MGTAPTLCFATSGGRDGLAHQTYPARSLWVAWPQTAAILDEAPHKTAVKLDLSAARDAQQHDIGTWNARTDVARPPAPSRYTTMPACCASATSSGRHG